ncbi:hypothetical protein [Synechococcus phage S-H34]|uniref:Uncharacterized protein n=1 Tax=Synechococcus phage S-H34 TaxID=2718942 RepID=A0A6G8R6H2_9CAUD|nr:hypothetical protein PQC15_gp117 [Synechococcus phage S-H34]QIN96988.1 hypothetical protein [Synechococcus phage S-H34]
MTLFTKLATTALAALTAVSMPAAALAGNSFQDHVELSEAIKSVGVRYYINPTHCYQGRTRGVDGFYVSQAGVLVVCQDNARGNEQVRWTANDLDTLRHEAIHLIQDCKDGRGDGRLVPIVGSDKERNRIALSVLGAGRVRNIIKSYVSRGANAHTIRLELEAFSFAQEIDASDITAAVRRTCGGK